MNTGAPWPTLSVEEAEARVLGIQTKLHRWAIGAPARRFGDLFNLVCDPAFLLVGWRRVRGNKGARTAGVDGQTAFYVERVRGEEVFLADLRAELKARTFRPLAALCHQLGLVLRGWGSYFRHGVSKATFDYLREFTWRRVVCWLRHKHPHANWRLLRRRYLPGWWPTDGAVVLFDLGKMAVTRYRYRAARIPTPWTATSSRIVA